MGPQAIWSYHFYIRTKREHLLVEFVIGSHFYRNDAFFFVLYLLWNVHGFGFDVWKFVFCELQDYRLFLKFLWWNSYAYDVIKIMLKVDVVIGNKRYTFFYIY